MVADGSQALVVGVAEHPVGALTELAGGRAREGGMQGVDLGQQADIGVEMAQGEGLGRRAAMVGDVATLAKLGDESGHLGAREAGDLAQVAPQAPLLGSRGGKPEGVTPSRKARTCSRLWSPWVLSVTIIILR